MKYSFSTRDVSGYGSQEGTFEAATDAAAQKTVFNKLAIAITQAKRYPDMAARAAKAREVYGFGVRLVNEDKPENWTWEGQDKGWRTESETRAEIEARDKEVAEAKKRGYRDVDGVRLPPEPLKLEAVIDAKGERPAGSSGYAHYSRMENGQVEISDGSTTGRFWPAVWDGEKKAWRVTGDGHQWKDGKVAETFPVAGSVVEQKEQEAKGVTDADWEPEHRYGITRKRAIELGEDAEYPRIAAAVFHFDKLTPEEKKTVIKHKEAELAETHEETQQVYAGAKKSAQVARELNVRNKGLNPYPKLKTQNKEKIARLETEIADLKKRSGSVEPAKPKSIHSLEKVPWEMTREQWRDTLELPPETFYREMGWPEGYDYDTNSDYRYGTSHLGWIKTALRKGKKVPADILREHPELAWELTRGEYSGLGQNALRQIKDAFPAYQKPAIDATKAHTVEAHVPGKAIIQMRSLSDFKAKVEKKYGQPIVSTDSSGTGYQYLVLLNGAMVKYDTDFKSRGKGYGVRGKGGSLRPYKGDHYEYSEMAYVPPETTSGVAKPEPTEDELVSGILNTEASFLPEKYNLPVGKAMPRTKEQSERLVSMATLAHKKADRVAITEQHPAWKSVNALADLMTDDELATYNKQVGKTAGSTYAKLEHAGTRGLMDAGDDWKLFKDRYIGDFKWHLSNFKEQGAGSDDRDVKTFTGYLKEAEGLSADDWKKFIPAFRNSPFAKVITVSDWLKTKGESVPWQMTEKEYIDSFKGKKVEAGGYFNRHGRLMEDHKNAVMSALQGGREVPESVIADLKQASPHSYDEADRWGWIKGGKVNVSAAQRTFEASLKKPVAKEPWGMTQGYVSLERAKSDFPITSKVEVRNGKPVYTYSTTVKWDGGTKTFDVETRGLLNGTQAAERLHKKVIEQSLSSGKPVPAEVLKDYPDLKPAKNQGKAEVIPFSRLQDRESSRSPLSQMMDEHQTNLDTVEPTDPRVKRWLKDPGELDVKGIDTPKKGQKQYKRRTHEAPKTSLRRVKK
jgi:hypothetical protein